MRAAATRRSCALTAPLAPIVVAVGFFGAAPAADASAPCADDTQSALRFAGLPADIPIGYSERFALDLDDPDWDVVGDIHVTIETGDSIVFDSLTDDSFAEFHIRFKRGEREATVSANFEQRDYANGTTCSKTIVRTASAFVAPVRLICNRWDTYGDNIPYLTRRPKHCSIWRSNWAHYQSATFKNAEWRRWGKPLARARATLTYSMGYHAPVRVRAYRLRLDCAHRFWIYTRVFIKGRDGQGVVRPDTCA